MLSICDKSSVHTFMGLFLTPSLVLLVYLSVPTNATLS